MPIYALTTEEKTVSDDELVSIDYQGQLDAGELLTGTPTVTEVTTTDLTLANKVVNTAVLTIKGESVAIGQAVQFSVTGGTASTTYDIKIAVSTDSTPTRTLNRRVKLKILID